MKKKILYMFFILQLLFIITNYKEINNTLFSIKLPDFLKVIVLLFNSLYILFIAKKDISKKIIYISVLFFTYVAFLYDKYSTSYLLTNFYYISSFSFLLFYFMNEKQDKFQLIGISYLSLIILDIILIINHQNSITIELLINLLFGISLVLHNRFKKLSIPVIILTLLTALLNDMNFVLYNFVILSLILLIWSKNKKDLLYNSIIFIGSIVCLIIKNIFSFDTLFHSFDIFSININITTFIIVIPLILSICYLITKSIIQKHKSNELVLYIYTSVVIISLLTISLDNIYNEFIVIYFAFLFILIIDKINVNDKHLKNEITFFVLHLGYGGIESSTINTVNELSKQYKVKIVSFYNLKRNNEETLDKTVKVKYLYNGEPNREEFIQALKNKEIINIISNGIKAVNILFLKEYLNAKEMYYCDSKYVVSTRNEYSILLSEYGNNNAIKIAQEHQHHRDNKKYIDNIKYGFNNIDYLFALTKSLKKDYEKFFENNNRNTKVLVVPNIIYLPKKKASLKNNNLVTISRLNPIKKIEDMIVIFNNIKDKKSKLYIVGDGSEQTKLEKIVDDLNLSKRVIFTGYKNKEEMEEYILKSKVFLLTSTSEGLPMVLLESMSYGVPCIAFKTKSGVSDIIDNNVNGYIIDGRNKEKYIEKLDELMNNKELLSSFSKKSLEKAKGFTAKEIIKKWQEVLENEK